MASVLSSVVDEVTVEGHAVLVLLRPRQVRVDDPRARACCRRTRGPAPRRGHVLARRRRPASEVPVALGRRSLGVEAGEAPVEHHAAEAILVEVRHPRPLGIGGISHRLQDHVVGVVLRLVHVHVPGEHDAHGGDDPSISEQRDDAIVHRARRRRRPCPPTERHGEVTITSRAAS